MKFKRQPIGFDHAKFERDTMKRRLREEHPFHGKNESCTYPKVHPDCKLCGKDHHEAAD